MMRNIEKQLTSPPEISFIGLNRKIPGSEYYPGTNLWAMILFDYPVEVEINDSAINISSGDIAILSPYTSRRFNFVSEAIHRTVHFKVSDCEESKSYSLINGHENFKELLMKFDKMYELYLTSPLRAKVVLWDLLLEVVDTSSGEKKEHDHPALKKAVTLIEQNINKQIKVSNYASKAGVSQTHLNLLFNRKFGTSTEKYILNRKMGTAEFLMVHSAMPIKEIACRVGYPDLQHFNKRIRRYFGRSPRQIRSASS